MKTPTWGTVIGILMIFFGGCGALNDIRNISMPEKLAEQKELMKDKIEMRKLKKLKESAEQDSVNTVEIDSISTITDEEDTETEEIDFFGKKQSVEEILDLPEFTKTWIVRFGYIGAFVSILYMLGGLFLLVRKSFSIKLVYAALVISILCSGAQAAVLTSSSSSGIIAISTGLSQIFGILIDIILLAIVFSSDKEAYKISNLT